MRPLTLTQRLNLAANPADLLRSLGSHGWTQEQIARHMAAELAQAPRPHWLWHCRRVFQWTLVAVLGVGFISTAVLLVSGVTAMAFGAVSLIPFAPATAGAMAGIAQSTAGYAFAGLLCSIFLIGGFMMIEDVEIRGPAYWTIVMVPHYDAKFGPLPAQAQELYAALIAAPGYSCRVHLLLQGTTKLDPILDVQAPDGTHYYPLVWDQQGNIINPPAS